MLAVLLTIFMPGLGYFYVGFSWQPALAILAALEAWRIICAYAAPYYLPWKMALLLALTLRFVPQAWMVVDVFLRARRLKGRSFMRKPSAYVSFFLGGLVLVAAMGSFDDKLMTAKNFRVPSASMEPTIKEGDRIRCSLASHSGPKQFGRGDVVAFRYPKNPKVSYVSRIVGLEGDRLQILDDVLHINGIAQPLTEIREPLRVMKDMGDDPGTKTLYRENLDEQAHYILRNNSSRQLNFGSNLHSEIPYVVPNKSAFVMGDNRDNSMDSRLWGPVAMDAVLCRVQGIVWSWDDNRGNVRWDRLFQDLNKGMH
jgi:signal peptidase I